MLHGPLVQQRVAVVREMLSAYVRSPSLVHLRSAHALDKLASEIIRCLDLPAPLWQKWTSSREDLVRAACPCWVPLAALASSLNDLPGPSLTTTDVSARLQVLQEELGEWPMDHVREGAEAIFAKEMSAGTEIMAILVRIRTFMEEEDLRVRREQERSYRERVAAERAALEARFLAGADCKWTAVDGSKSVFCRMNGRVFRLRQAADGRHELERASSHASDDGILAGRYARRADATAAVKQMAYGPDVLG